MNPVDDNGPLVVTQSIHGDVRCRFCGKYEWITGPGKRVLSWDQCSWLAEDAQRRHADCWKTALVLS